VFEWDVKNYGNEIDLFVDHSQIVQLEALRSGIWGTKSTWGRIQNLRGARWLHAARRTGDELFVGSAGSPKRASNQHVGEVNDMSHVFYVLEPRFRKRRRKLADRHRYRADPWWR